MKLSAVLLASMPFLGSAAAQAQKIMGADTLKPDPSASRLLNLTIDVTFPDSRHINPPRILNEVANRVNISIGNFESSPVSVEFVGGGFWKDGGATNVANLTQKKIGKQIKPDNHLNVIFPVKPWLTPAELHLALVAILRTPEGKLVQVPVFNQTVSVEDKEAPFLLFDPELLFLYVILAGIFGGAGYYAYQKWLAAVVPKKKPVKKEEKPVVVTSSVEVGKGSYDQSWIPEHHIRKTVQRGRSGTPKGKRGE